MDYTAIMSKALEYTKSFVDAAIPVAKQAYEIALITLQVDAAGKFLIAIGALVFTIITIRMMLQHKKAAVARMAAFNGDQCRYLRETEWSKFSTVFDSMGYNMLFFLCMLPGIASLIVFLDIWMWAKLIKPELWLVHEAIEAVVSAAKK